MESVQASHEGALRAHAGEQTTAGGGRQNESRIKDLVSAQERAAGHPLIRPRRQSGHTLCMEIGSRVNRDEIYQLHQELKEDVSV